jgi:hypothetical protein
MGGGLLARDASLDNNFYMTSIQQNLDIDITENDKHRLPQLGRTRRASEFNTI